MQFNLTKNSNPKFNGVNNKDASLSVYQKEDDSQKVDEEGRLFPVPQNVYDSIKKVEKMREMFALFMEFAPKDIEEVHSLYDDVLTDEDIENYKRYGQHYFSLDKILWESDIEAETYESLVPDDRYEKEEFDDLIYESLYLLNKYERELLMQSFGIGEYSEHSLEELSRIYHKDVREDYERALFHFKKNIETMM